MRLKVKPKRIVSLALAGCMAVSMVPASAVTAFAAENTNVPAISTGTEGEEENQSKSVTVEVTGAGKLEEAVKAEAEEQGIALSDITELTVKGGPLNAADFQFMSGVEIKGDAEDRYDGTAYTPDTITCLKNLTTVNLSEATCENNAIPPKAFYQNTVITKIILPNNLEKTCLHAFSGMSNLKYLGTAEGNLKFPDTMKIMGEGMVYNDANLAGDLTLPSNLEEIGSSCFCRSGVSGKIVIPASVNTTTTTTEAGTTKQSIQIFLGTKITSLTFGNGTKEIGTNFARDCSELEEVVLPDTIEKIGDGAFRKTKLSALPNLKNVTEIGDQAFADIGLTGTLTIPDGVEKIGELAFNNNQFSGTIVIPESVQSIGMGAFSYAGGGSKTDTTAERKIDSIIVENPQVELGAYALNNQKDGVKLYFASDKVPDNSDSYWTTATTVLLATAGGTIDTTKDFDPDTGLYAPEKEGYTFAGWYQEGTDAPVTAANKPEKGKKYVAKWSEKEEPMPVGSHTLTVKGGTVKVNGAKVDLEKNLTTVPEDATVEVTFDKDAFADSGLKFGHWDIKGLEDPNAYQDKESFTFTMPAGDVTLEAMPQDATIEDEGPDILGTAAVITTAAVGGAVLAWQGYQIGTELYLTYLLPAGAAIPANTAELAKLVWTDAGKPAPAAVLPEDATEEQQAMTWAVESGLISADKAADASVSKTDVIKTWKKAQEMKG